MSWCKIQIPQILGFNLQFTLLFFFFFQQEQRIKRKRKLVEEAGFIYCSAYITGR